MRVSTSRARFSVAAIVLVLSVTFSARAMADDRVVLAKFSGPRASRVQKVLGALLESDPSVFVAVAPKPSPVASLAKAFGAHAVLTGRIKNGGRRLKVRVTVWSQHGEEIGSVDVLLSRAGAIASQQRKRARREILRIVRTARDSEPLAEARIGRLFDSPGAPPPPLRTGSQTEPISPATPPGPDKQMTATVPPTRDAPAIDQPASEPAAAEPPRPLSTQRKVVRGVRRTGPIELDGRLDDPAWAQAEIASGFMKVRPDWGQPSDQPTMFRVVYDDDAIYVAVEAREDNPSNIMAPLLRKDDNTRIGESDWVIVRIDSSLSRRNCYVFAVNPAGVQRDMMLVDDWRMSTEWSSRWTVGASRNDAGWTAEFRIPYSQLRFEDGAERWGFDVFRLHGFEIQESWSPIEPTRQVSQFGDLVGLADIESKTPLNFMPYALGGVRVRDIDPADTINDELSPAWNVGLDFSAGLPGDATLSGAINPDFGQVEADPSEVNLTDQETFFPERRPMFVESAEVFGFSLGRVNQGNERLFHTRRVGAPPHGSGGQVADYFDEDLDTTIVGAGQVRGTVARQKLAMMSALSNEERTRYIDPADGMERTATIEPLTSFNVAQIGQDLNDGKTSYRLEGTAVVRKDTEESLQPLHDQAFGAGLALRQRLGSSEWELNLRGAASHVRGSPEAIAITQTASQRYFQRPDASHVELDPTRESLSGFSVTGSALREPIAGLTAGGGFDARSPGFEVNDAGFLLDSDLLVGWSRLGYAAPASSTRTINVFEVTLDEAEVIDWGMEVLRHEAKLSATFKLDTLGALESTSYFGTTLVELDRSLLRGGPAVAGSTHYRGGTTFFTSERNAVLFGGFTDGWSAPEEDSWSVSSGALVGWRLSRPNLRFILGPWLGFRHDDRKFMTAVPDAAGDLHYILADVVQREVAAEFRVSYMFNTRFSVELYLRPFVSTNDFSEYKELVDPRANYDDQYRRFPSSELIDAPPGIGVDRDGDGTAELAFPVGDFEQFALQSNLVVRWEFSPDCYMTGVWSQNRSERVAGASYTLFNDFADSFSAPGEHAIFVRASYWFGR